MDRSEHISVRSTTWFALCVVCVAWPSRISAQTVQRDTLRQLVGYRVRVELGGHGQRVGTLLGSSHDSVSVYACGHCEPFRFAKGDVARIDVSRGWSEGRVYRDLAIGFLAGGATGYVIGKRSERNCRDVCGLGAAISTVGGAITGMIAGGIFGSRDHWVRAWP
ncbi:MAG: hypothetical protein ACR2OG_13275 [Gemmatimonadaceae bacterium]